MTEKTDKKNYSGFIPSGVGAFSRAVYAADYRGAPTSQEIVEKFMETVSDATSNDRVYLLEYVATACDVALGLNDAHEYKKNMYDKLEFDRRDAIRTAIEGKRSEIKTVDESERSLAKRLIPAGSIYVPIRSATLVVDMLPDDWQWAPELVGAVALAVADIKIRFGCSRKRSEIRKKYKSQIAKISKKYKEATGELEKLTNEKNGERFIDAEKRLTNCYESCYGIDLEGVWDIIDAARQPTSAEEYKTNDAEIMKRHLKRVDPIL